MRQDYINFAAYNPAQPTKQLPHGPITEDTIRAYGLDRIEAIEITNQRYELPGDFSASDYFSNYFGIVIDKDVKPERIVIRSNADHTPYLKSLPLHHTKKLIEDNGQYAEFELYLAPTYNFVMKPLQAGAMIEVIPPLSLRRTMNDWITAMHKLYKNI